MGLDSNQLGIATNQKTAPDLPIGRFPKSESPGGNRVILVVLLRNQFVDDGDLTLAIRVSRFLFLLAASWVVMTFTHEMGHIIGGTCCGGTLKSVDLLPWHLPYSIFEPDPFPLVTLWAGLIIGVLAPVAIAIIIRREWMWFVANFCVLANGAYIATAWFSDDRYLDTPKLLEHGASPIAIGVYCLLTIGFGYVGFRRSCVSALSAPTRLGTATPHSLDEQSDARKLPVGREFES